MFMFISRRSLYKFFSFLNAEIAFIDGDESFVIAEVMQFSYFSKLYPYEVFLIAGSFSNNGSETEFFDVMKNCTCSPGTAYSNRPGY